MDKSLLDPQHTAQAHKRGLWALQADQIQAPWDYRKKKRQASRSEPAIKPTRVRALSARFSCNGKTKCGQMTNCAEAKFYYEECCVSRLDVEKDGVPCESPGR